MSARKERMTAISTERHILQSQIDKLDKEMDKLRMEQSREDHPCSCVKLNGDISIFDMVEQERRGRTGLGFGFVSETLSCDKDCQVCHGTGKPGSKEEES